MKTLEKMKQIEAVSLNDADDAMLEQMKETMVMQFNAANAQTLGTVQAFSIRAASAQAFALILAEQRERSAPHSRSKRIPK